MSLWSILTLAVLAVAGCKNPDTPTGVQTTLSSDPLNSQLSRLGIVRIRSTYSLASGDFQSTCSGVLLHSGDKSVTECVALSAASCFKHMPRNAEHSIEFFDPDGRSSKLFRAHDILIHPSFDAQDARLSLSESARDVALIKFNCTLPVSVQSVRIANFKSVPVNGKLLTLSPVSEDSDSSRIRYVRNTVRIESFDFPAQTHTQSNSLEQDGVLTLRNHGGQSECGGNPGSPVFFQNGRELLLIASLSLPASDCLRSTHRYTLLSPHVEWMKKTIGTGAVSYDSRLNSALLESDEAGSIAVQAESDSLKTAPSRSVPLSVPLTLPRASALLQSDGQKDAEQPVAPTVNLSIRKDRASSNLGRKKIDRAIPKQNDSSHLKQNASSPLQSRANSKAKDRSHAKAAKSPASKRTPAPQPERDSSSPRNIANDSKLPNSSIEIQPFQDRIDIPPPALQNQCVGKRLVANSKTRVWGTVIKLIDRPSDEILDETMKCDIPNEVEICLSSEPLPTHSSHAVARLLLDLEMPGCEKFKSGESVYILNSDFISY